MNRFLIPLLVFVILIAFLAVGLRLNSHLPSPLINQPAPTFTLPNLPPQTGNFSPTQMTGKVWLLNVWASWCAACRDEHPLLNKLAADDVAIVGLNYKDDADNAAAWLRELGNPYLFSPVDDDGAVAIEYGVYGVPETYLIDRDGVIRFKQVGPVTVSVLENEIMPRLETLTGTVK